LEYAAVRALFFLVRRVPDFALPLAGRIFGGLWQGIDWPRRRVCRENLSDAFPEKSEEEIRRLSRAVFNHVAVVTMETVSHSRDGIDRWLERVDDPRRDEGPPSGPVVWVAIHFGFWEFTPGAAARGGKPVLTVNRPLRNPLIAGLIDGLRTDMRSETVPKGRAARALIATLKRGEPIGLLVDQYAGRSGLWVPFFGRPASTVAAPARMALRFKAPLRPLVLVRKGLLRYELRILPDIPPEGTAEEMTAAMNRAFEAVIRELPEQWLWLHKRWKGSSASAAPVQRPPARRSDAKAVVGPRKGPPNR
jgi:KDO2-lipid IV(A) lauroyltransferase